MQPANFDRAVQGVIRFRGRRGDASRGDLCRIRALFGEQRARELWQEQARTLGFQSPRFPNVWWARLGGGRDDRGGGR